MSRLPKQITDFMEQWDVSADEVWPVPGGKAYAVKHSALERIAAKQGIVFGPPQIIEAKGDAKVFSLWGCAMLGDRSEWSTGEATPANNKNAYPLAMAEKRLKDRLTLKFLALHGVLYSEEEADDFKQPKAAGPNPDYVPPKLIATDPEEFPGDAASRKSSHELRKHPERWHAIVETIRACASEYDLRVYAAEIKEEVAAWPLGWRDQLADVYRTERERITAVAA